jgi:exopolysaccharide production protein ExoF
VRPINVLHVAFAAIVMAATSPVRASDAPYRLGIQDRVRIHVHEWPVLTGEFTIGPNGTVTLPLIGEVKAQGSLPSELANSIASSIKTKVELTQLPETAVDILQFRPFYITGGIERPGEYAYRPGMIVLNAVAIAGGVYRPPRSSDWSAERDTISGVGDMRVLAMRRLELQAKAIRLRAEAQGAEVMPAPPADLPRDAMRFYQDEVRVFGANKERLNNQVSSQLNAVKIYEGEIEAIRQQIKASQKMHESVVRELEETKGLVSRGLAPAPRVLPLERTVAQIESEQKALESAILRARQMINTAEAARLAVIDERRALVHAALQGLEIQALEIEERYDTASRVVSGSSSVGSLGPTSGEDALPQLSYSIVRSMDGRIHEISATETSLIAPGDIVKVLKPQDVRRVRTSAGPRT